MNIKLKLLLLIILIINVASATVSVYVDNGNIIVSLVLCLILLVLNIYAWTLKVWVDNGVIHKRSVLGVKSLSMSEIEEISIVELRSRYVFILISCSYIFSFSSLTSNFYRVWEILKDNLTGNIYSYMENISCDNINKKLNFSFILLLSFAFISIFLFIYLCSNPN